MAAYAPFLIERVQTEAIFATFIGLTPFPWVGPRRLIAGGVGRC